MPDLVVTSTAKRARTTAELARITGGWRSRMVLEDGLYGAGVDETLELAATHAGTNGRVMLVGHQPTWSMTVRRLTGSSVDMRTATIADIAIDAPTWDTLPEVNGTLTAVLQPRDYLDESDT